jgi:hypothetical protein
VWSKVGLYPYFSTQIDGYLWRTRKVDPFPAISK